MSGLPTMSPAGPERLAVRPFRSLRFRITAAATVLVALTLVLASAAIMRIVRADLLASAEAALNEAVSQQAEELGLFEGELIEDDGFASAFIPVEIDGELAELGLFTQEEADGLAYGELTLNEQLIALVVIDPDDGGLVELIDPITFTEVEDPELVAEFEDLLFEVYEFEEGEAEYLGPLLVGAAPLDDVEESIDALQGALLMIVPLLVVGFGLGAWLLVGRALRPVLAITSEVEDISTTSLDRRVPVPDTGDEVSELATVMNRMLGRLQRGDERRRQFAADASHELRSPLTTVRVAAELIERRPEADRTGRLATEIMAEADRMEALIDDLLALAKLDEDAVQPGDVEPVDLGLVATAEVERLGRDTPVPIEVEVTPGDHLVTVARRHLQRLVTNLVDNACHHATSTVRVTVSVDEGGASLLTVDDDGPGVDPEDAERIFERFARLDDARDRREGGAGLGLALVKAIAEGHGATVSVGRAPLGGASFIVRF